MLSSLSAAWPGTEVLSRSIDRLDRGSLVPAPVVAGVRFIVPRSGKPLRFPVSEAVEGSVGDGVVALTPGPDVFAGDGALCANAEIGAEAIRAAMANLRSDMVGLSFG